MELDPVNITIESFLAFFAVGALGFWLLVLLANCIFIYGVEADKYVLSVLTTIGLTIIYYKAILAISFSWPLLVLFAVTYTVIGVAWSFWRWLKYIKKAIAGENRSSGYCTKPTYSSLKERLAVSNNKGMITGWIVWWPWSMFWNISGDFFHGIVDALSGLYQKITDKALAPLKEMEKVEKISRKNTE